MYRGILPQSDSDWGEFLYTFDLGLFLFSWSLAANFFLKLGRWVSQRESTRQEEEEEEEERASQEEEDKNKAQGKIHKYKI